jgi:ATP-binding cassette subfamily C protein CydC
MSAFASRQLVRIEQRRQARRLLAAAAAAAVTAAGAVLLLGLSGWFLAAAALSRVAGPAAVLAFNYVLPSAAIRFLAIARTAGRYIERLASHEAAFKALARIRPALFAGLAAGPPERSLAFSSGEASGRLVQDVNAIETLFVRRSAPVSAAAACLSGATLIALANLWAGAAFIGAFILQVMLGLWLGPLVSHKPGAAALAASGRLKDAFQSAAAASAELRCYGLGAQVIESLMAQSEALGEARARRWSAEGLLGLAPAILTGVAVTGILALAAQAPPPLAALAALAGAAAMEGGGVLGRMFDDHGAVNAAMERLGEMLSPAANSHSLFAGKAESLIILHHGAESVTLEPGDRLALTGRSGAGKTLLLEMLAGLRQASPGSIIIDGQPLEDTAPGAARALFAISLQDCLMISGTVRANLRLGDPAASEDAMWTVLADASLDHKVRALPFGLDSWIGEGGERLSGGERRRLSLARAYLRPAPWLLLDEPTEGLDTETEKAVVEAMAVRLNRTGQGAIIVSHRPAPLVICTKYLDIKMRGSSE